MQYRTIPIVSARAFEPRPDTAEPSLKGSPERIGPLLESLQRLAREEFGITTSGTAWLREFRLEADEALLRLAPMPGVCGPELAQAIFDLLRRELHDTDIYVHHAPH